MRSGSGPSIPGTGEYCFQEGKRRRQKMTGRRLTLVGTGKRRSKKTRWGIEQCGNRIYREKWPHYRHLQGRANVILDFL